MLTNASSLRIRTNRNRQRIPRDYQGFPYN